LLSSHFLDFYLATDTHRLTQTKKRRSTEDQSAKPTADKKMRIESKYPDIIYLEGQTIESSKTELISVFFHCQLENLHRGIKSSPVNLKVTKMLYVCLPPHFFVSDLPFPHLLTFSFSHLLLPRSAGSTAKEKQLFFALSAPLR
jgi:hypothetical protein